MNLSQNQLLSSFPPFYFEWGGGILLFAIILWIIFFKIVKRGSLEEKEVAPSDQIQKKPDLKSILTKTSDAFTSKLETLVLGTKKFDDGFLENLEELLYTSDLGAKTVETLLSAVKEKLSRGELSNLNTVKQSLYGEILKILKNAKPISNLNSVPWVILVVGVNGVGKTTSIGKLAQYYSNLQKKVLVVAGDTFRAAAEAQLAVWGERAQVEVYTSEETKDPAAVTFQGIQKGLADKKDIIIVDTAGRLHTKDNLMEELKKIKRAADKALPGSPHEIILVIDGSSGQNARVQAEQFNNTLGLTSLIVTKLDGTARGGIIVGIAKEVGIGVQFIGLGEQINDFEVFSPEEFTKVLLRL